MNVGKVLARQVPVLLDKERHLKYDLNAFARLEDLYGSITAVFDALQSGSARAVRDLLWAGLVHEDKELKPEDVGAWVGFAGIKELTELIMEATQIALPEEPAEKPPEAAPAKTAEAVRVAAGGNEVAPSPLKRTTGGTGPSSTI